MPPHPAPERWSKLVVILHWTSTLLVFGLIAAGVTMTSLDPLDPLRRALGRAHTLSGILLGVLTLGRLVVIRRSPGPAPDVSSELHRKGIAAVHALLYALTLAIIATGLGTVLRMRPEWHGYLEGELPKPPSFEALASRTVHEVLAMVLGTLVFAHVLGVAVQELKKRRTLRRMLPFLR